MPALELANWHPRWRARLILIALFVLFFAPVVLALLLNIVKPEWLPTAATNRGELITPAAKLSVRELQSLDGVAFGERFLTSKWTLMHVADAGCAPGCRESLLKMRQARLALGKDADRVQRLWLVTGHAETRGILPVLLQHPGLRIAVAPQSLRQSPAVQAASGGILLIDPSGYAVMRYRGSATASDVLKDMKRLLKISGQG